MTKLEKKFHKIVTEWEKYAKDQAKKMGLENSEVILNFKYVEFLKEKLENIGDWDDSKAIRNRDILNRAHDILLDYIENDLG